jgi:2-polyprenyl-6-methoxyphenol hydroxylase-like FAD-dependent oxidoreductase
MRIAIIGGGIGGLTAALALRQLGFEPQVFEQAPELLEVGGAIIMWPNAMRVLHRLGLSEQVRHDGGVIEEARWLNQDGRLINHFALPRTDLPAIVLHRARLQEELLRALPTDSIHLGHVFESFEQQSNAVVAKFTNGSSLEFDLLIGADGLHSRVRAQLLEDGPPVDRGYIAWRGVVSFTPKSLPPASAIEIYGNGKRFGIGPLGFDKVGWWASVNEKSSDGAAARGPQPANVATHREELLQLFDGWCEPVPELLRATPLSSLILNPVFDRRPVRKWGEGSVTLLGDAIHPLTPNLGQGGCLAIEDAAILARCLNKYVPVANGAQTSVPSIAVALRKFEMLRFARTATLTRCSRMYGVAGQWENRGAVWLRRMALSSIPDALSQKLLRWVIDYDAYGVSI